MPVRCSYSARITLVTLEQHQYCSIDSVLKQTRRWASPWSSRVGLSLA
jgi:hypothetical protein